MAVLGITMTVRELRMALERFPDDWRVEAWTGDMIESRMRTVTNPQGRDGRVILWCGEEVEMYS